MSRIKRTQPEWFSLIEQYNSAAITAKAFCQQEAIHLSNFYYWQKRHRSLAAGFVPLTITGKAISRGSDSGFEIVYPNGVILRLAQGVPLNVLSPLLRLF